MKSNIKKTKKELEIEIKHLKREKFLEVYSDFTRWMYSLGFRTGKVEESSTLEDYNYSHYDNYVDSLYGVELYIQDTLNLSIRFLRDRYEHKFLFTGGIGSHSDVCTLEHAKEIILNEVRSLRDEQMSKLKELENI